MLIDEIKKANIEAMKNKDANLRSIYSVVMNKYMQASINARAEGKEMQDADFVRIIQKTIKELEEECENYKRVGNAQESEKIEIQKKVLEKYLPQLLTKDEIKSIIDTLEDKSLPSVMRHFKTNYNGKCDMKLVGEVVRNL